MAPTRVLVVDDEPMVTEVVGRYLEREGFEVALAADGYEALRLARQDNPDLVVLDLMLPRIDGLEVCRVLRRETRIPIIMLTAKEFDFLYFLAPSPGQVFSRDQLMNHVWDFVYAGDSSTVTVHIRRLREKIEADPERPRFLKTVWGVGYKFEGDNGRP